MIKAIKFWPGRKRGILFFYAFLWLIFCTVTIWYIHGVSILPDEYGYWAQAAKMVGYDWSMVSARQRYYSFGYGFILAPILRFFDSAQLRYRMAVILQFVGMALSGFILHGIFTEKTAERIKGESIKTAAISGVVMFYAAYLIYAQTTMAEICLTLLFLGIARIMKDYLEEPSLKKALILCALSVWLYTVHMRTVIVVLVCFLMILVGFSGKKTKKRGKIVQLMLIILFFAVCFAGAALYKKYYQKSLTVGEIAYNNVINDYAGQVGKIKYFFSIEGFWNFLVSLAGKLFYGISASFGVFFWGILEAGEKFLEAFKSWKACRKLNGGQLFSCFLFLTVSAMIFTAALAGIHPGRLDGLFYGRYYEFILPCILYLGVEKMLRTKYLKEGTLCWIIFQFIAFFVIRNSIVMNDIRAVAYHSVIGVSYAFYFFGNRVLYILLAVYMVGGLLGVGTTLLIGYIRKTKRYENLFFIAVLQIMIAVISFVKMIIPANEVFLNSVEMTDEIWEEVKAEDRRAVAYHIYNMKEADRLQFYLKDKSICVVPDGQAFNNAALKNSDFVFLDKFCIQEELMENEEERLEAEKVKEERREDMEILENVYDTVTETANWFIYYNKTS